MEILVALRNIEDVLNRAHPEKPTKWFGVLYRRLTALLRYVGIPALVLAAVNPVWDLGAAYVEHQNKKFLTTTYNGYADTLLDEGFVERASNVVSDLQEALDRDVKSQYTAVKVSATSAVRRGRDHRRAEDQIRLLLRLHRDRGVLFPEFGGKTEILALELALVDIEIQLGGYEAAIELIEALSARYQPANDLFVQAQLDLRSGSIDVLRYNYVEAVERLGSAKAIFRSSSRPDLEAEATFQLAKALQFSYQLERAVAEYGTVREIYSARGDKLGLSRVDNNVGMIFLERIDYPSAGYHFESSQRLARSIGDDLGIARAAANLALIAKRKGDIDEAIAKGLEAQEAFRLAGSQLGLATTFHGLAESYFKKRDYSKALHNAEQARVVFYELGEARGLADTFGTLARLESEIGDVEGQVYASLGSLILRRELGDPKYKEQEYRLQRIRTQIGIEGFRSIALNAERRLRIVLESLRPGIDTEIPRGLLDEGS